MTAITEQTIKSQELVTSGLVESASIYSTTDFTSSKLNEVKLKNQTQMEDFTNTFICHLIFYTFFCFTLILYIFIDLGLGSFIKNIFVKLIGLGKKTVFDKAPAFA